MKHSFRLALCSLAFATSCLPSPAQEELYPNHFNLDKVQLLDGELKRAMDLNFRTLLTYDTDRLLTPFVRQAGLNTGKYTQWQTLHPNFTNWGGGNFDLSGHVGGHYLSALALGYASCQDATVKQQLKERLDYMVSVLKDCQDAYATDATGLKGFIGGQPINNVWQQMFQGNLSPFQNVRGWVPFYCQHKVMAGLRDAAVYANNDVARELFRAMADWAANVVDKLTESQMQGMLDTEHGGMNEVMADAFRLFGDGRYYIAAKKYSHQTMVNGLQSPNGTFLDNRHANTQVPKYIGFERAAEEAEREKMDDAIITLYTQAAENFWADVALKRTTCIGGNSVGEHFLSTANSHRYIDHLDGPESCNTNNMLKLSEMLSDRTHDARYADFYEYATLNHMLSTQDPTTGGYVYFTTLRPQGYRIYSQPNQGMWCCVGTGMENHSKYAHFAYTHDGAEVLYVNLFIASRLVDERFALTQETCYPYEQQTKLTMDADGTFTLALRHPWWTTEGYKILVNGEEQPIDVKRGEASYVKIHRTWKKGDVVTVRIPMELRTVPCPNYEDYVAFEYGPVLLGAKTTAENQADADTTGLAWEVLQNEYAGDGRMDHAPGSMAQSKQLTTAPLLIGERSNVLQRIRLTDSTRLRFTIDVSRPNAPEYKWERLTLQPFATIHHARYMCYWYQQTAENFAKSDMALEEQRAAELASRTIDFVATGEQQSEAGHEYNYSTESTAGSYNNETYRDAGKNGHIQYSLFNPEGITDSLSIMLRFTTADRGRQATLSVDGVKIADITIPSTMKGAINGFYNIEYPIPASLAVDAQGKAKNKFTVRLAATGATLCPGLYYLRLMRSYDTQGKAYKWVATDWTTGDTGRLPANRITYNDDNTLTIRQSGTNNVCLMLDYAKCDYTIQPLQKYLLVIGTNLGTESGQNYLWWLNGSNRGTQVPPTFTRTLNLNNGTTQQAIAWDLTQSGIAHNISTTGTTDICAGQTIFGLTSTTGESTIRQIAFVQDFDQATSMEALHAISQSNPAVYDLSGRNASSKGRGIHIVNQKKVIL